MNSNRTVSARSNHDCHQRKDNGATLSSSTVGAAHSIRNDVNGSVDGTVETNGTLTDAHVEDEIDISSKQTYPNVKDAFNHPNGENGVPNVTPHNDSENVSGTDWPVDAAHYRLLGKVGRGAFATVYKAQQVIRSVHGDELKNDSQKSFEDLQLTDHGNIDHVCAANDSSQEQCPDPKEKHKSNKEGVPEGAQDSGSKSHEHDCLAQMKNCAIKVINLEHFDTNFVDIRLEVQTMRLSQNENILSCYTSFIHHTNLWLVTQLMDKGISLNCIQQARVLYHPLNRDREFRDLDLESSSVQASSQPQTTPQPSKTQLSAMISRPPAIDLEHHITYILHQTILGLQYIHSHGQIHRDIKASNILLDSAASVKIADFGVSGWLIHAGSKRENRRTFVGTPCWMAPEVMEQIHGYDTKADIWSLGITALELAKGYAPYAKYPPMEVLLMTIQDDPPGFETYPPEEDFNDDDDDDHETYDDSADTHNRHQHDENGQHGNFEGHEKMHLNENVVVRGHENKNESENYPKNDSSVEKSKPDSFSHKNRTGSCTHKCNGSTANSCLKGRRIGKRVPHIPSTWSQSFQSMIRWCLQKDPAKRPNCEQLLEHEHFRRFLEDETLILSYKQKCKEEICDLIPYVGDETDPIILGVGVDTPQKMGNGMQSEGTTQPQTLQPIVTKDNEMLPVCVVSNLDENRPSGTTWIFTDGSQVAVSSSPAYMDTDTTHNQLLQRCDGGPQNEGITGEKRHDANDAERRKKDDDEDC